ncbi:MAG: GNAT family N-acetyltransferase [Planctomycetota bacterium]
MEIPPLSDGTIALRPFVHGDRVAAVDWISGPISRDRSATDGGPVTRPEDTDAVLEDLGKDALLTIELEGEPCGLLALDHLRTHTDLRIILARPQLWVQGIGSRAIRLCLVLAFDHMKSHELQVLAVPEDATAARVAWEGAGFGIQRRFQRGDRIFLDFALSRRCHEANEQVVHLIRHGNCSGATGTLDAIGRAQAEALATCPLLFRANEAICSDRHCATTTAEQAFVARGIPCTVDEAWREQELGDWSTVPLTELPRREDGTLPDPPGGETGAAFARRVGRALDALPHGDHLAVVTHGDVIACLLRGLESELAGPSGLGTGAGIPPASVSELRRGPEGWRVVRIADDRHLLARDATSEMA